MIAPGGVIGSSVGRGEVPHFAAAPATDSVRDGGVDGIGRLAQQGSGRVAQIHARGAGVIVISRKRTGLQSHDSSIGCAIALGQSGLACVVLDLTLCSTGSSTQ